MIGLKVKSVANLQGYEDGARLWAASHPELRGLSRLKNEFLIFLRGISWPIRKLWLTEMVSIEIENLQGISNPNGKSSEQGSAAR